MGYAILRTQKLKSGIAVRRSLTHAFRERETPNADASRTPDNTHIGAADVDEALAKFNERLATQDKVRKNAVLAVEYLITASPEDMHGKTRQEQDAYFRDALKFVEDKHGKANVVYAGIHRDEQTPHMYAYVVPIDQRGKLNCRSFLGGAKALNQMQTEFAQEVGQQHGLQRGIEGSKARHVSVQQYYSRVNKAFEPLPEVKTLPQKVRLEPAKPGLFAGKDASEAYKLDHAAWVREKAVADQLAEQRKQEVRARSAAAVETARRHEAQAKEAAALRAKVDELKKSNGVYVKKATDLTQQVSKLAAVVEMLTPVEVQALADRKRAQEAEKVRLAELARSKAAEVARVAKIEAEAARRVQGIQKLLQRGGAEHTFAVKAATALREAGDNASKVDWKAVERVTVLESMGKHGQSAENVTKALLAHSPGRADPATHAHLTAEIKQNAAMLEAHYEKSREAKRSGPQLGRS
jgi:hypothetical protein